MLAAVTMLAACSTDSENAAPQPADKGTPITLAAAVEGGDTRSGSVGSIDYKQLTATGFGVFASSPLSWENLSVTYNGPTPAENPGSVFDYPGSWTYGKLKYWNKDASGGPVDFYAYAPYVSAGSGTSGITGISGTNVTYAIATTPSESVDLLWGVKGSTGLPWTGTTYATTGGPVLFTFRHALAAIGFHVQAMIDQTNDTGDLGDASDVSGIIGEASSPYKITIKQVSISGSFHKSATLNLANTIKNTPNWGTPSGSVSSLTIDNSLINTDFQHPNTTTSTDATTAQTIMEGSMTGITQQAQQKLINPATPEQLFFVIPNSTQQNYTVTIDWCVSHKTGESTYSAEDHTSTINVNGLALAAGNRYYINMVFGLKTVNLTVTADDWTSEPQDVTVKIEHGTSASESLARKY